MGLGKREKALSALLAALLFLFFAIALSGAARADVGPVIFGITVNDLPSTCEPSRPYWITDGASDTDCSTGSGSTNVLCVCNAAGDGYNAFAGASGTLSGSGTLDYLAKWSSSSGLTDSGAYESGAGLHAGQVLLFYKVATGGTCSATEEGGAYYDTDINEICFCNGSNWTQLDGGGNCVTIQNWTDSAAGAWQDSAASAWQDSG